MTRTTPLPRSSWPQDLIDLIEGYRSNVKGTKPEENRQSGNNLFGTFAHYPELTEAFLTLNGHLLSSSTLTLRDRELLILRVAFLRQCEYEWAQHVILGERAGLTIEEIDRVATQLDPEQWTEFELALLSSVGELLDEGKVHDSTWDVLAKDYNQQQLMDLTFTVGCYAMLAMAMRSLEIELEPGLAGNLPATW